MRRNPIVVIGGGLAAAKAVQGAREQGFVGDIVLLSAESHLPYERPALSKAYLRGESGREQLAVHEEHFYADHDVEIRTDSAVVGIDRSDQAVQTAAGDRVPYTRLLLATGAEPRRLDVPGAGLDGVHLLRTVDDADRLHDALTRAEHVVVVGGGWIGAEVAASARQLGRDVTIVHRRASPLQAVLGAEVARTYRDLHTEHGVTLVADASVEALRGDTAVEEVVTDRGTRIAADLVVVGVGATPRDELAIAAGLAVADGVAVDHHLRTSDDSIFAAGDVAAAFHPHYGRPLRVEHWANAVDQGLIAGRNLAGGHEVHDRLPYFFSDQYDVGMEYVGDARGSDRVVLRGSPAERTFVAFWVADARVVAAMSVNTWDVIEPIRELIRTRTPVDDRRLRDLDVEIEKLGSPRLGCP